MIERTFLFRHEARLSSIPEPWPSMADGKLGTKDRTMSRPSSVLQSTYLDLGATTDSVQTSFLLFILEFHFYWYFLASVSVELHSVRRNIVLLTMYGVSHRAGHGESLLMSMCSKLGPSLMITY